jgi:Kef-type K+ transport system membrane component KefB
MSAMSAVGIAWKFVRPPVIGQVIAGMALGSSLLGVPHIYVNVNYVG